jgi:hypothetical protein
MTNGNETQTQTVGASIWSALTKTIKLCKPDHARDDRAHERVRGKGVDSQVQAESIDSWLKRSSSMVDRSIVGLAENQRRVRYFGFEATDAKK